MFCRVLYMEIMGAVFLISFFQTAAYALTLKGPSLGFPVSSELTARSLMLLPVAAAWV